MDIQEDRKPLLLFIASVLFLVVGLFVIFFIDKIKDGSSEDIRARASEDSSVSLSGIVSGVQEDQGILTVSQMKFLSRHLDGDDLGEFTVYVPRGFSFSGVRSGSRVTIYGLTGTFNAYDRTVQASKISVSR